MSKALPTKSLTGNKLKDARIVNLAHQALGPALFSLWASDRAKIVAESLGIKLPEVKFPGQSGDCRILLVNGQFDDHSILDRGFILPVRWVKNENDKLVESSLPKGLLQIAARVLQIANINRKPELWSLVSPSRDGSAEVELPGFPIYDPACLENWLSNEMPAWESAAIPLYISLMQARSRVKPKHGVFSTGALFERNVLEVGGLETKADVVCKHKGVVLYAPKNDEHEWPDLDVLKAIEPSTQPLAALNEIIVASSLEPYFDVDPVQVAENEGLFEQVCIQHQFLKSFGNTQSPRESASSEFYTEVILPAVVHNIQRKFSTHESNLVNSRDTVVSFLSHNYEQAIIHAKVIQPERHLFFFSKETSGKCKSLGAAEEATQILPALCPTDESIVELSNTIASALDEWKINRANTIFEINAGPTIWKATLVSMLHDEDLVCWIEHESQELGSGGSQVRFRTERYRLATVRQLRGKNVHPIGNKQGIA